METDNDNTHNHIFSAITANLDTIATLLCYVIFYVVFNYKYVGLHHFDMEHLAEVSRAEAETCF